jgi:hypothetical protein
VRVEPLELTTRPTEYTEDDLCVRRFLERQV